MMFPNELATIAAQTLNAIPAGLAIAAVAWFGLKVFSKQGSGVRFAVWFLVLVGIAALPFVPSLQISGEPVGALHTGVILPASWAIIAVGIWSAILGIAALRLFVGMWNLGRLKREASAVEISELPLEAQSIVSEFQQARPIRLLSSERVRVPTAIGFFRPAVLLPTWALELPEQDLTAVLLHEFAHLRRRDDWTNLAQKLLGAVFFFHPAVWFVQRRLELEREMACDEMVLAKTGNSRAYAECLVSLAERSVARRSLAMAQSLIGHAKSTAVRLRRILDRNHDSASRSHAGAMTFASATVLLCVGLAGSTPRLISFQDEQVVSARATTPLAGMPEQQLPAAAKVEASFHPRTAAARLKPQGRLAPKPLPALAHNKAPANFEEVLARETVPDAASSRTRYVLVMQTLLDGDGEVRTNFCVWKLTLGGSDNRTVRAQVVMSSL